MLGGLGERRKLGWRDLVPVSALFRFVSEFREMPDGILQDLDPLGSAVCGLSSLAYFRCRGLVRI